RRIDRCRSSRRSAAFAAIGLPTWLRRPFPPSFRLARFHVKPQLNPRNARPGGCMASAQTLASTRAMGLAARIPPLPPFAIAWDTAAERHRRRRSSEVTQEAGRDPGLAEDRPTMTLLVAAIAATVAAILESTITQYLRVGDAQ